jgi:hypothetical protein
MKKEIKGYFMQHLIVATSLRIALMDYFEHCKIISEEIQVELPDKEYVLDANDQLRARRVTIVVLSAALCEACINTWLALHLEKDIFALVERSSTVKKWKSAPKLITDAYNFPDGDVIDEDLKFVFDWRNAVMHTKTEIYSDEETLHKSNYGPLPELKHNRIERIAGVTLELLKNLAKYDRIDAGMIKNAGTIYSSVVDELALYHLKRKFSKFMR